MERYFFEPEGSWYYIYDRRRGTSQGFRSAELARCRSVDVAIKIVNAMNEVDARRRSKAA